MVVAGVKKVAVTLRNNWKKSLAGAVVLGFTGRFAEGKLEDKKTLREYSAWAQKLGAESISAVERPRRITVLINPLACDGKAKGKFEKNALPLLNLAGIEVSVITPGDSAELENIVAVIDKREADGVFVIGGDGALSKVVTGAARNNSCVPIGVFPGGKVNVSASMLIPKADREVKWYCDAAKAVIANKVQKLPLMKVEQIDEQAQVSNTTYAVSTIHWGPFRNVESIKNKYWIWGGLKTKFAYLWSSLKQAPDDCQFEMTFTLPCAGCSQCYVAPTVAVVRKRWWQNILGFKTVAPKEPSIDYSRVINETCGIEQTVQLQTTDLIIKNDPLSEIPQAAVAVGKHNIGRRGLVKEGWARGKQMWEESNFLKTPFFTNVHHCRDVTLVPLQLPETWKDLNIDGETVSGGPLKLSMVPNKIQFFTLDR